MKHYIDKIQRAILQLFLVVSIVWNILFGLNSVSAEIANLLDLIIPAWNTLYSIYWGFIPSLLSILIAFANLIYSSSNFLSLYKSEQSGDKQVIGYFVYAIISLVALLVHFFTLKFLFECALAG